VVGMITETTLFRIFLELLGARRAGIRLTVSVSDTPGQLAKIAQAIFEQGGNIIALGAFLGETTAKREMTLKVDGVKVETLKKAIQPHVDKIIDIRMTSGV